MKNSNFKSSLKICLTRVSNVNCLDHHAMGKYDTDNELIKFFPIKKRAIATRTFKAEITVNIDSK